MNLFPKLLKYLIALKLRYCFSITGASINKIKIDKTP